MKADPSLGGNTSYFDVDPQIYRKGCAGRLSDATVAEVLREGAELIPELVARSKAEPLVLFWNSASDDVLVKILRDAGVSVSAQSRKIEKDYVALSRTSDEYDLMPMACSVRSDDPDGIYHVLGKNGGITNSGIQRPEVNALLTEGKAILDPARLDTHYQKVALAALREVPFVHLGYARAVTLYRKDQVKVNPSLIGRGSGRLDAIEVL
ncbi:MAG: hypothetical protein AAB425_11650 [Bdellovibrionota bacterium]